MIVDLLLKLKLAVGGEEFLDTLRCELLRQARGAGAVLGALALTAQVLDIEGPGFLPGLLGRGRVNPHGRHQVVRVLVVVPSNHLVLFFDEGEESFPVHAARVGERFVEPVTGFTVETTGGEVFPTKFPVRR